MLVVRKWRKVMANYVNRKENLIQIMKMLRAKSVNIQFETFHIFKIFIANPNKHERVIYVLKSNIKKLIKFMKKFLNDKCSEDNDLKNERQTVIESLQALEFEEEEEEEEEKEEVGSTASEEAKHDLLPVGLLPLPLP